MSDIVVVRRFFPLGEKNALFIDFELRCVAIGSTLVPDLIDLNFLMSHKFTSQSSPAVASVYPFGCKLQGEKKGALEDD